MNLEEIIAKLEKSEFKDCCDYLSEISLRLRQRAVLLKEGGDLREETLGNPQLIESAEDGNTIGYLDEDRVFYEDDCCENVVTDKQKIIDAVKEVCGLITLVEQDLVEEEKSHKLSVKQEQDNNLLKEKESRKLSPQQEALKYRAKKQSFGEPDPKSMTKFGKVSIRNGGSPLKNVSSAAQDDSSPLPSFEGFEGAPLKNPQLEIEK